MDKKCAGVLPHLTPVFTPSDETEKNRDGASPANVSEYE